MLIRILHSLCFNSFKKADVKTYNNSIINNSILINHLSILRKSVVAVSLENWPIYRYMSRCRYHIAPTEKMSPYLKAKVKDNLCQNFCKNNWLIHNLYLRVLLNTRTIQIIYLEVSLRCLSREVEKSALQWCLPEVRIFTK